MGNQVLIEVGDHHPMFVSECVEAAPIVGDYLCLFNPDDSPTFYKVLKRAVMYFGDSIIITVAVEAIDSAEYNKYFRC